MAMANTIFEVLVMSCGTGGYKVRINQYYKGCSRQYVALWLAAGRGGGRVGGVTEEYDIVGTCCSGN